MRSSDEQEEEEESDALCSPYETQSGRMPLGVERVIETFLDLSLSPLFSLSLSFPLSLSLTHELFLTHHQFNCLDPVCS